MLLLFQYPVAPFWFLVHHIIDPHILYFYCYFNNQLKLDFICKFIAVNCCNLGVAKSCVRYTFLYFSSVQSLSHVQLFVTPWIAARQASLSITNSRSLLKLVSIESVTPSNHLILCCPFLLPSIFPSISLFRWVSSSPQVNKVLEFQLQHQSFHWIFRTDFL